MRNRGSPGSEISRQPRPRLALEVLMARIMPRPFPIPRSVWMDLSHPPIDPIICHTRLRRRSRAERDIFGIMAPPPTSGGSLTLRSLIPIATRCCFNKQCLALLIVCQNGCVELIVASAAAYGHSGLPVLRVCPELPLKCCFVDHRPNREQH
jgi:hypothetical protein